MTIDNNVFVDSVPESELRDALRAATENLATVEGIRDSLTAERDRIKLDLQRQRERSSVELAEAKVAQARLLRTHNEQAMKINRLEAECIALRLQVDWHQAGKREILEALGKLINAYSAEDNQNTSGA